MVGNGILWFTQYAHPGESSWSYGILAVGNFAYQSDFSITAGP